MVIKNGLVFGENCKFAPGDLWITGEKIAGVSDGCDTSAIRAIRDREENTQDMVIDAAGMYVIPGLTDIHFHGCAGYDLCDGSQEAIRAMAKYQAENGITTICPATMTYDEARLTEILKVAGAYPDAQLVGIHLEGPFLSPEKKGAQNEAYLQKPDADLFFRLQDASHGKIKIVDVAPELEGAMEFIDRVIQGDGGAVSLSHTAADYETAMEAFSHGANHVTHLFNAMPGLHHRAPGVVGAAADCESAYVELIGDGIHCSPAMVRAALKMIGSDRLVLISDSMRACGMPDGTYSLGGQAVIVKGRCATLSDGTIAGSVTNLMECMQLLITEMGVSPETAVRCAAVNPAKAIGIYDRVGSLSAGKYANVVILDRDFTVHTVIQNGKPIIPTKKV